MKRIYNRISLALASLGPVFSVAMAVELVLNPYESVDWGDTDHSKAQFHAHTTASDGSWNPHQVVDRCHAMVRGTVCHGHIIGPHDRIRPFQRLRT